MARPIKCRSSIYFFQPRTFQLQPTLQPPSMSTCHRCTILRTFRLRQFVTQPSYRKQLFPRTLWFQPAPVSRGFNPARCISKSHHRYFSAVPESPELCDISTSEPKPEFPEPKQYALPICCPGCGAYSQTVDPDQPGYYGKTRKQTRKRFAEINRALGVKGEGQENAADLRTKGENAARDIEDLMTEEEDKPPKPKSTHFAVVPG